MSNTEFVMVPRELVARIALAGCWPNDSEELREILAKPADHQGEPVALPGRKDPSYVNGVYGYSSGWNACLDEIAKLGPLYAHADTAEVARLTAANAEYARRHIEQIAEVDALRASIKLLAELDSETLKGLRAQLSERDSLLLDAAKQALMWNDIELLKRILEVTSASAEPNQCRMGKTGGYADTMSCQAGKYASAEPSAPVEIDERAAFEMYCEKVGLPLDRLPSGEYLIPVTRFVSQGWHAHASAALERRPSELEIAGYEGSSGLYYSRHSAVANGEQVIEPVYRVKK